MAEPEILRLARRAAEELRRGGPLHVLAETALVAHSYLACAVLPSCRRPRPFEIDGHQLRYVAHPYNHSWRNERAVELALAHQFLAGREGRILEVGNVLGHYFDVDHEVVDRYERAPGVRNVDVLEWAGGPYDAIVSISTVEHIGFDEVPRDAAKGVRALAHLRTLLAPDGAMLVTVPLDHNAVLDRALSTDRLGAGAHAFFVRQPGNTWQLADPASAFRTPYDRRRRSAGAIFVGIWHAGDDGRAASRSLGDELFGAAEAGR